MSRIRNFQFAVLLAVVAGLPVCGDEAGVATHDSSASDISSDTPTELGFDLGPPSDADQGVEDVDVGVSDTAIDTVDSSDDSGIDDGTLDVDTAIDDVADTEAVLDQDVAADSEIDAIPPCETTVCGPDRVCCPADTECILDACLPVCGTGVRCGDGLVACCDADQVCLEDSCIAIGGSCLDSYDCPEGEFCEPTLDRCLAQPAEVTCQVVPVFEAVEVYEEWSLDDEEIISIPLVGDLDGDALPEVVINITRVGGGWEMGELAILSGENGFLVRRLTHNPSGDPPTYGSHGRSTAGIADLTGDGLPDIVYAGRQTSGSSGPIHAVNGAGDWIWTAHESDDDEVLMAVVNGAPSFANFDEDPMAEVVFGATLIDHNGLVVWNEDDNGATFGTNAGYTGGISAIADLDGDHVPEIVSGRHAWKVVWTPGADPEAEPTVVVTNYWSHDSDDDGYPAIADLDGNGTPEVVLVANRTVRVLEGETGLLWCGRDSTGAACDAEPSNRTQPLILQGETTSNRGGPPTIADFDGDGRPEIGIAGGYAYTVYDVNRPGEEIVQPNPDDPDPPAGAIYIRWTQTTRDRSSNATGSSVFDFQGDGAAEVVYADECYMRVYSGADGAVEIEIMNSSATIHEYPLVVDVDGDNNSEILIVATVTGAGSNCAGIDDYEARQGLYVYGSEYDDWVRTRRVWNQHSYHVTNATSVGHVPFEEADNWTVDGLNNYRQNVQGEGVFNSPDLTVELSAATTTCEDDLLTLQARVSNVGSLGVPAGVDVRFYLGADAAGTLLGSTTTAVDLLPGAATTVSLAVDAPGFSESVNYYVEVDCGSSGAAVECEESNNGDGLSWDIGCPKGD